jgi:hypothetical protein
LLVFFTGQSGAPCSRMAARIENALMNAKERFQQLQIPRGYLPAKVTQTLLGFMNIRAGDTFWELGAGECYLAYCLSAAAEGGVVVVTDKGNGEPRIT